jgi:hypothetical protein
LLFGVALACRTAAGQPLEGYANYETFAAQLRELEGSELVTLSSLGKTLGGREIYVVRIAKPVADAATPRDPLTPREKPALLIVGSAFAPQLHGSELAVRMAQQIVAKSKDEAVQALLDKFVLYIVPRPNPDATESMFVRPYYERGGNGRSTDDDRDFEFDEDPFEDLNGDGWITMMRVEDPSGKWMPHPSDERVMIEADANKNERGRYLLYTEGRDNDGDEKWNEDGPGGVDFNRNFSFRYKFFSPGAGPHQVSEIETRGIADFAFDNPQIAAVFSFTPQDNLLVPWKPGSDGDKIKTSVLTSDAKRLNYVAELYRKIHGGKDWPTSPQGEGSFCEWAYFHYGRWSFGARGWWIPKIEAAKAEAPITEASTDAAKPAETAEKPADAASAETKPAANADEPRGADELNALRYFASKGIDGFVPWTPIEHPDFPGKKVEVGGFKPLLRTNPPAAELDGLAEKHLQFLLELTPLMPRLEIDAPKVEALGEKLYRVTVKVRNTSYLPTMAEMGKISKLLNVLQVKIDVPPGAKLLTGSPRVKLDPLTGNGGEVETVWLLDANQIKAAEGDAAKHKIRAWSASVGTVETEFNLP